jgi:hypothetical protein
MLRRGRPQPPALDKVPTWAHVLTERAERSKRTVMMAREDRICAKFRIRVAGKQAGVRKGLLLISVPLLLSTGLLLAGREMQGQGLRCFGVLSLPCCP